MTRQRPVVPRTKQLFWLAFALALGVPRSAQATYSILAVDRASEYVGGAGTSCIDGADVYIIYRSVPGIGVVHAQATINYDGRGRAIELLEQHVAPGEILSEITSLRFDPAASVRQYAVANVTGQVAAFTGEETRSYAADLQGSAGAFGYSVQGNILTGAQVLTQVAGAFELDGCDLAERLMRALAAGADNGHGDSRCTEDRGIPSDSAFLQVDRPGEPAGDYLSLRVPTSGQQNPLVVLREQYDQWRSAHPCLAPTPDLGTASMASSAGVGGAGSSGTSTSGANSAVQGGATAPSRSGGNISPGADGSDGLVQARAEQPGCACATSSRSDDGSALAGLMLLFAAARLRKSAGALSTPHAGEAMSRGELGMVLAGCGAMVNSATSFRAVARLSALILMGTALAGVACKPRTSTSHSGSAVRAPDVPYEPSPHAVVRQMLQLANVQPGEAVYDLGCGDGRIVIAAVRDFGARGVCVDIDPERIRESRENVRQAGVAERIEFRNEDLFQTDLGGADVVTLFLWPSVNLRLRPKLLAELDTGSRVVSYVHSMGQWQPEQVLRAQVPGHHRSVYLWRIP